MKSQTTTSALVGGVVVALALTAVIAAFIFMETTESVSSLGPEYSYDIEKLAEIDPALILYQQHGEAVPTAFKQSYAIAIAPDGKLWVAGDKKMGQLNADGSFGRTIECAVAPTRLTFDADGLMYVALTDHIVVFDAGGKQVAEWEKPQANALLTSLAAAGEDIFAADAVNKVVWRWRKDGTLVSAIGRKDPKRNIPGFVIPSPYFDIAIAPDGLLRVVDSGRHLIEAYTFDGHREWWWGTASVSIEGFSGCCNPVNMAILPNGHFILVEKGLVRVKEYDPDGHFIGVVAGPEQLEWTGPLQVCDKPEDCQTKGFDVAVDTTGRVYVLDTVKNVVRIFEKKVP